MELPRLEGPAAADAGRARGGSRTVTGSLRRARWDDEGGHRLHHRLRRLQHAGGRRTALRVGAGHHPGPAAQIPAAPADPHHLGAGLQHVPGAHRAEEAHLGVAGEQALVAVHPDRDLGGDVAEKAERVRAVDEVPAVVGVAVRNVPAVDDGQPEVRVLAHAAAPSGTRACTRKLATSPGVVPRPKTLSAPGSAAIAGSNRGPPTTSSGRDSPIASRNAAASSRVLRRWASFCVTTCETRTASARAARARATSSGTVTCAPRFVTSISRWYSRPFSPAKPLTLRIASMPTVCASVPMQAPRTTSLRRNRVRIARSISAWPSSG